MVTEGLDLSSLLVMLFFWIGEFKFVILFAAAVAVAVALMMRLRSWLYGADAEE
jgi:uncharacterized membrane protein YkgB